MERLIRNFLWNGKATLEWVPGKIFVHLRKKGVSVFVASETGMMPPHLGSAGSLRQGGRLSGCAGWPTGYKGSIFWEAVAPATASWAWRGILSVRHYAAEAIRHVVGDGRKTLLWTDPWLSQGRIVDVVGRNVMLDFGERDCLVSRLIVNGQWALTPPLTSTMAQLWEERKRVELPARGTQDQVVWSKEASGEFSMGSACFVIRRRGQTVEWCNVVWHKYYIQKKRPVVHDEL